MCLEYPFIQCKDCYCSLMQVWTSFAQSLPSRLFKKERYGDVPASTFFHPTQTPTSEDLIFDIQIPSISSTFFPLYPLFQTVLFFSCLFALSTKALDQSPVACRSQLVITSALHNTSEINLKLFHTFFDLINQNAWLSSW
jgi:hypothetical protein